MAEKEYCQMIFELQRLTEEELTQICEAIEDSLVETLLKFLSVKLDFYSSSYIESDGYGLYVFTILSDRELTPTELIALSQSVREYHFSFSKVYGKVAFGE